MSKLARTVLEEGYKHLAAIMVQGVKLKCLSIVENVVELELSFYEEGGRDVVEIIQFTLRPGDDAVIEGLERALTVILK